MAGNNIKGITIDIGGNTTGLSKALADVNKTSKNLQNELKQVDKLLKLDPKNTEILEQKQKLLSGAIGNTKEKLETLKEAERQAQQQFQKGEISEEQYRALQREVIKTEQELKELEKAAEGSNSKLDKVADAAGKFGERAENAGKKMLPVTAGIAAIGAAGVASFNELDAGYDTIITKTGATGEALDGLQASMDTVFGDLPTTAEDAGIAIGEVNTRFGVTGEMLETLSGQFIKFAEINETDLNTSIGTTHKIMQAWNLDAAQTPNVLGLITTKAQQTGISVDVLMNSVLENNSVFKEMGLTFEQSIGLMAQFERNGVNSQTALAGLKKAVVNYAKDGLTMEEGLRKTIDSIKNAGSETKALALAQEVFGTKGAAEMTNAIREGRFSVDDLCGSMEEYGSTVEDTFNATLDPPDRAKVALNNLKIAGADLGNSILSALAPALEKIIDGAKGLAQWFGGLSDGAKTAIVVIGGIIAAIGPALITIGKISTGISSITRAAKIMGPAISAALKAFSPSPIALVVTAIAALVAGFVYLWNNCEGFRNFFIGMWEHIKAAFQSFIDWASPAIETIKGFFIGLWEKLQEIWAAILESLQPLKDAIFGAFQQAWELIKIIWDIVQPYFQVLWDGIQAIFSVASANIGGFFNAAWTVIQVVWDVAVSYFQAVWDTIQAIFSVVSAVLGGFFSTAWAAIKAVWDTVTGYFTAVWETIKGIFAVVRAVLSGNWSEAWEAIKGIVGAWAGFFSGVWESIKSVFSAVGSWFSGIFSAAWEAIKSVVSTWASFFSGVWNGIKSVFSAVGSWFSGIFSAAWNAIKQVWGGVKEFFSGIWGKIKSAFNVGDMLSIGTDLIKGLWNGINNATKWILDKIKGFCGSVLNGFKSFFGIKSPSRVMRDQVGKMLAEGISVGIDDAKDSVISSIDALVTDTRTEVQKVTDEMNKALLESEKKYAEESERLKDSKEEKDKEYLEGLKSTAEKERKIYDAMVKDLEAAKKRIVDTYKEIAQEAFKDIEELEKAQDSFADKLKKYGSLWGDVEKQDRNGRTIKIAQLSDISEQTRELEEYERLLLQVKERGNVPKEFFYQLRDMSVEEGMNFSTLLLQASDEEFDKYISDWTAKQEASKRISKELYQDEAEELAEEIDAKFAEVENSFFSVGEGSADEFEAGFLTQLKEVVANVKKGIAGALSGVYSGISVSVQQDTPEIPRLARGGIALKSVIANVGEFGKEAILPLENNLGWLDTLAGKLTKAMYAESGNAHYSRMGLAPNFTAENSARAGITVNNNNYGVTPQTAYEVSEATRRTLSSLEMQGVL